MGRKIDPRFLQRNQPGQNQQYPQVGQQPAQPPPPPPPPPTQVFVYRQQAPPSQSNKVFGCVAGGVITIIAIIIVSLLAIFGIAMWTTMGGR